MGGHLVDHLHVHLDPSALLSLRCAQCYPYNLFTTRLHVFIKQTADPTLLRQFALSPDSAHISLKMMAAMFTVGHRKSSTEQKVE